MKITWKNYLLTAFSFILFMGNTFAQNAAEETYAGENFSLEGALALFKKAASPESFERALNTESNTVNNLDLNEDGETDFIRVTDYQEGSVHAIVLQVDLNQNETQDIAVIEMEQTGNAEATLQIVGDEWIYGQQTIVEPFEEKGSRGGKGGPSINMETAYVVVNVWAWPAVRFIYGPRYRVYRSPFVFGVRPRWHRIWRPRPVSVFRPLTVRHRAFYRVTPTHRVVRAHRVYVPNRRYSPIVRTRTTSVTTVRKANGRVVGTKKTTTVRGRNGVVNQSTTRTVNPRTKTVTKRRTTTQKVNRKTAAKAARTRTTVRKRNN